MIMMATCVLLDVAQGDPGWGDWSQRQLEHALGHGGLVINPIVYAEFSAWCDTTRFRTCFPSVALLAPQGS
jgi:hypothetical protein